MRLVVDTNVLVSALLNEGRAPDRALATMLSRGDTVLYDGRIALEYRTVLARPKFRTIDARRADGLIAALLAQGKDVGVVAACSAEMIDALDRPFVEVAIAGGADAILTGNARHYPTNLGFEVLSPSALLARFGVASR